MQAEFRARLHRALADLSAGERSAFDDVFALAWPVVRALCARMLGDPAEAEDTAQRALLQLFAHASRFDPRRDALPWVLTFAIHEVRTVRTRRRRRASPRFALVRAEMAPPDAMLERADLLAALYEVVGTLRPADRAALGLDLEGADPDDTACNPVTRRKRRQRALERLRSAWRKIHGLA